MPHLPTIAAGTWRERRLSARYREGARVVRRTLDPLGLVLKGGAWYLVAHRSAGMRVYRVSRFASVRIREDGFERPDDFELGFHLRREAWAQGYALEAARAVIEWAPTCGATSLMAGHHPDNHASAKLLNKLGFVYYGDEYYLPTGLSEPCYRLALAR